LCWAVAAAVVVRLWLFITSMVGQELRCRGTMTPGKGNKNSLFLLNIKTLVDNRYKDTIKDNNPAGGKGKTGTLYRGETTGEGQEWSGRRGLPVGRWREWKNQETLRKHTDQSVSLLEWKASTFPFEKSMNLIPVFYFWAKEKCMCVCVCGRMNGAIIKGYEEDVGNRTSVYVHTAHSITASLSVLRKYGYTSIPKDEVLQLQCNMWWCIVFHNHTYTLISRRCPSGRE